MLEEFVKDNWMSLILGGSGIFAWGFRYFENRAAQKETVAHQAMEYIGVLSEQGEKQDRRIAALEASDKEKTATIAYLTGGVTVLTGQLSVNGIKPLWTVEDGDVANETKSKAGGFSP